MLFYNSAFFFSLVLVSCFYFELQGDAKVTLPIKKMKYVPYRSSKRANFLINNRYKSTLYIHKGEDKKLLLSTVTNGNKKILLFHKYEKTIDDEKKQFIGKNSRPSHVFLFSYPIHRRILYCHPKRKVICKNLHDCLYFPQQINTISQCNWSNCLSSVLTHFFLPVKN